MKNKERYLSFFVINKRHFLINIVIALKTKSLTNLSNSFGEMLSAENQLTAEKNYSGQRFS